jgi:hypothetical protein
MALQVIEAGLKQEISKLVQNNIRIWKWKIPS